MTTIRYTSPTGHFIIIEQDGMRDYRRYQSPTGNQLITNDKRYLIRVDNPYQYLTADIGEMAYWLIKNKSIQAAKEVEANKVIKRIQEALQGRLI